jgi:hypothetical protein
MSRLAKNLEPNSKATDLALSQSMKRMNEALMERIKEGMTIIDEQRKAIRELETRYNNRFEEYNSVLAGQADREVETNSNIVSSQLSN